MMGGDIEGIINGIETIKNEAYDAIICLSRGTAYRHMNKKIYGDLYTIKLCTEKEDELYRSLPKEKKKLLRKDIMSTIRSTMESMSSACGKMESMGDALFTDTEGFNNSIGSPWSELSKLQDAVSSAECYAKMSAPFGAYDGDKAGMLAMLNMIISFAVDAKWAMIYYHDFAQRGFDHMFNNDTASVTFTTGLNGEQSIGNVNQQFDENVHIPEPNIDPY